MRKKILGILLLLSVGLYGCGNAGDTKAGDMSVPEMSQKAGTYEAESSEAISGKDGAAQDYPLGKEPELSTEQAISTEQEITTEQEKSKEQELSKEQEMPDHPGSRDPYESILAEYADMVRNNFYEDLLGTDRYESSFGEDVSLEIRTHKQDVYYALYDIDGNGSEELIIAGGENGVGVSDPNFSPWNYALYGFDGTKAVRIFPEMEFGYRTNFSLCDNGVIEVSYSASAAESGIDFYRIGKDGITPEALDSFAVMAHLEKDQPVFSYFRNGQELTEEEYNADLAKYEIPLATAPDWVQIS